MATGPHASLAIVFEIRGIAVSVKLPLLPVVPLMWNFGAPLSIVIVIIGSVSSHVPRNYRHRLP
jgi:hypothetical protein